MGRVLIVEDEPNIGGIIEFKLAREGHSVRWERGAASVLAAAGEFSPQLVLLDTSLDDGDWGALLDALRARCPVVVLTEFRDEETPGLAVARGAARVVGKPFKPTVLAKLVGEVLAEAAAHG